MLDEARRLATGAAGALLATLADRIAADLAVLDAAGDVPVQPVHGDLHVGQMLRSGDDIVVIDFDGDPVSTPPGGFDPVDGVERRPAMVDLAALVQSVDHVARVVAKYRPDLAAPLDEFITAATAAVIDAYGEIAAVEHPPAAAAAGDPGAARARVRRHRAPQLELRPGGGARRAVPMSWAPERLLEDVEAKPQMLRTLAAGLRQGSAWGDVQRQRGSVLLIGIGSSRYAAEVAARRLRRHGIAAVAESSAVAVPAPSSLNVVISAGGTSAETLAAAESLRVAGPVVALTNDRASPLAALADHVVTMDAGVEVSGVASRSFAATLVRLLELEAVLAGDTTLAPVASLVDRAADAVDDLLARRGEWLDDAVADVGRAGRHVAAVAARTLVVGDAGCTDAARGAAATGCWLRDRGVEPRRRLPDEDARLPGDRVRRITVGRPGRRLDDTARLDVLGGRRRAIRRGAWSAIDGDNDPDVALLAEVTVAELLATALRCRWLSACVDESDPNRVDSVYTDEVHARPATRSARPGRSSPASVVYGAARSAAVRRTAASCSGDATAEGAPPAVLPTS